MSEPSAVVEAPPRPTLKVLQALMQIKQEEYEQLRETHAELWARRKAATLDREGYITYLLCEDRMGLLLQEMEQLKPQVLYGEAEAALTTGTQHYDAHCAAVTEAATQICQTLAQFVQACAAFVTSADEQIRLLWSLPDARGELFDLPEGSLVLQRLLGTVPGQQRGLVAMVITLLQTPLTVGDSHQALEMVPGVRPFPETLVRRFLAGYQVETSQPEEAC